MEDREIFQYVDHTLLKPDAHWDQIDRLCREAVTYRMASVCVPPCYVRDIHQAYGDSLTVCTVVGFPLGYSVAKAKAAETEEALRDGATEIDMVVCVADVKNRRYGKVEEEIQQLKGIVGQNVLKVIIENCYLEREEKIRLCQVVTEAGADFIKTSTGFGTGGATLEDIYLMREHVGPGVKLKAAGGIRTREDMEAYIQAGCSRLGTSSAIAILT